MPRWENSNRRDRLPPDWPKIQAKVLRRDQKRCQIRGPRCEVIATEADHIRNGDDHSMSNLQAVCHQCHKEKSSSEGGAAKAAQRRKIAKKFQRTEDHPGLL